MSERWPISVTPLRESGADAARDREKSLSCRCCSALVASRTQKQGVAHGPEEAGAYSETSVGVRPPSRSWRDPLGLQGPCQEEQPRTAIYRSSRCAMCVHCPINKWTLSSLVDTHPYYTWVNTLTHKGIEGSPQSGTCFPNQMALLCSSKRVGVRNHRPPQDHRPPSIHRQSSTSPKQPLSNIYSGSPSDLHEGAPPRGKCGLFSPSPVQALPYVTTTPWCSTDETGLQVPGSCLRDSPVA